MKRRLVLALAEEVVVTATGLYVLAIERLEGRVARKKLFIGRGIFRCGFLRNEKPARLQGLGAFLERAKQIGRVMQRAHRHDKIEEGRHGNLIEAPQSRLHDACWNIQV